MAQRHNAQRREKGEEKRKKKRGRKKNNKKLTSDHLEILSNKKILAMAAMIHRGE